MSPLPLATVAVALALLMVGCSGGDAATVVSGEDVETAFQAEGIRLSASHLFYEDENLDMTAAYSAVDASEQVMLIVNVFESVEVAMRYAGEDGDPALPESLGKAIRAKNVVVYLRREMPEGREEAARRALSNV